MTQRLSYSESLLDDVKLHFNVVDSLIPEHYKNIRIGVYRQETDQTKDGKESDLNMQQEIACTVIPRKIFELHSVLQIKMKVKSQPPMDITIPLVKNPEVIVGLVKLHSFGLYNHRAWFHKALHVSPYSERLYSFSTNNGMTMSIEQLYASMYSVNTAQALLTLWGKERQHYLEATIQFLKEHLAYELPKLPLSASLPPTEVMIEDNFGGSFESLRLAIESIEDIYQEMQILTTLSLETCENAGQGKALVCNVLSSDVGGGVLRRSVWKKVTAWQYVATNLNVHLLSSKYFSYSEMHSLDADESGRDIHFVPSITLGCPAAHELKFQDGGLRRVFFDIPTFEQKLMWMHAIQSPTLEPLRMMFEHTREATSLFGSKCSFNQGEELAALIRRKYELSRRIDICSSQALGCALTSIRTIIMLAATGSATFLDILGRSLRIGFLVMFQSMLSTQGAELGMIEDLELAALWLHLVTVRIVTRAGGMANSPSAVSPQGSTGTSPSSSSYDGLSQAAKVEALEMASNNKPGKPVLVGKAEDVTCRRDTTGRLIVDMKVTPAEAAVVLDALNYMNHFEQRAASKLGETCPFRFSALPSIIYAEDEVPPRVFAVAEVVGLAFTQGVNEMQTLANLSSSRDVLKQVDINQGSLSRLKDYFKNYREALDYQLIRYTPEMIDALASAQQDKAARRQSFANAHTSTNNANASGIKLRRSSFRWPSMSSVVVNNAIHNEALSAAVSLLKAKVLGYSDRC